MVDFLDHGLLNMESSTLFGKKLGCFTHRTNENLQIFLM